MILDTSAVCAICFDEPGAHTLLDALESAASLKISAPTVVELNAVLIRSGPPQVQRRVERLLEAWEVEVVPFDGVHAAVASRAYRDYGRGTGHPAALNLGDCYSYALAVTANEPLLFVGDDFAHTDVDRAT